MDDRPDLTIQRVTRYRRYKKRPALRPGTGRSCQIGAHSGNARG